MEEKRLIIKFHNGKTYEIPASIIAAERATHYARLDGYEIDSQEFLDEMNNALDDEFLIFEHVQTMKWPDLKYYTVEKDNLDLEEEWEEGNHTISVNW